MKTDDTQPNIKTSIVFTAVYQLVVWTIPLVTTPYISRILEPDGVGITSYTGSIQYYFSMFAVLGTASYGAREISMNRDNKTKISSLFWEIELLNLITTTISLGAWTVLVLSSDEYRLYYAILTLSLIRSLLDIGWFFAGLEKFRLIAVQGIVFQLLNVIAVFVVLKYKSDLPVYMLVTSCVSVISALSFWVYLPKYIIHVRLKELHIVHHIRETLVYFIPTFATSIYTVLDKTLIGLITRDKYENGYYEQAHNAIGLAKQISYSAINTVLAPRISYLFANNRMGDVKKLINKSIDYVFLVAYGSMFGMAAIASVFVPVFFGNGYEASIDLIYIMCPLVIIISVSYCLGTLYYSPVGLRAKSAMYIVAGSVVNLIMNLALIPVLSSTGAAIGSIIAELLISVLYLINCNRIVTLKKLFLFSYKRIISGIVMFLCLIVIGRLEMFSNLIKLIIQIISGVLIYGIVLLILRDAALIGFIRRMLTCFFEIVHKNGDGS